VRPFPAPPSCLAPQQGRPALGRVTAIRRMGADGATLHVVLDLGGAQVTYQAGDHCGLLPRNAPADVAAALALLRCDDAAAAAEVALTGPAPDNGASRVNVLPARTTLREALAWYVDLAGPPKKSTLRVFASYAEDAVERATLRRLLATEGAAEFRAFAATPGGRTALAFLRSFPATAARVPVGHFLEAMPRLAPRFYSIASDQQLHKTELHLCVKLVDGGVCSRMLAGIAATFDDGGDAAEAGGGGGGRELYFFVRRSGFNLSLHDKKAPIIMVGPGTGVAPFVGFAQRRAAWLRKGAALGPAHLYFGCRGPADFLYEDELSAWVAAADGNAPSQSSTAAATPVLTGVHVAFSRAPAVMPKTYVQALLMARGAEVARLLVDARAYFYVCGDAAHMARDVEAALLAALEAHAFNGDSTLAAKCLERHRASGRYLLDVWSSAAPGAAPPPTAA